MLHGWISRKQTFMVNILVVSHSRELACGVKALADSLLCCGELAADGMERVQIIAVGGVPEAGNRFAMGTSTHAIGEAICKLWNDDGILVLFDIGSALMSTEMALDLLADEQRARCCIADAPLVEGTIAAAMEASLGRPLNEVCEAAEAARQLQKL